MFAWLSALGGIVLVDLVLSGDNALVIGAAAAGLPKRQRWTAIVAGGAAAIVLRIGFAILATLLLQLPLLQAIGGAILLVIAIRLLMSRQQSQLTYQGGDGAGSAGGAGRLTKKSFLMALVTILVADATMSLDNVLAVGALADGNLVILSFGLLLSIILLMLGSALISTLISRLPWLLDVASLVLAWTSASMILSDLRLGPVLNNFPWTDYVVPMVTIGIVLSADLLLRYRSRAQAPLTL